MDFSLSYAGFDLHDPEKERVGILALQLKEKEVLHSVSPRPTMFIYILLIEDCS